MGGWTRWPDGWGVDAAVGRLSELYQLPLEFLLFLGVANLVYGSYSLCLALRTRRARSLILVLVAGNLSWGVVCFCCAVFFSGTASVFGLGQLVLEGLFVGGLGALEWRWREFLYGPPEPSPP